MFFSSPLGARMMVDGQEVDYFCGTSYYALHGNPRVIEAARAATLAYGMGPGTSAGMPVYAELEAALCDWFRCEKVTYLISGYLSPMALMQGLASEIDTIFMDEVTHYSGRDAIAGLGLPIHKFAHLSPDSLRESLQKNLAPGQRVAVLTDGVFPSTGALPPLGDYRRELDPYGGLLCVDDSHGLGVLGAGGRGALEYCGAEGPQSFVAGTLSKAFGGLGGIVPGPASLAEKIAQNAMVMRGASPPPPASAAAALEALRILREMPEMRQNLAQNVQHLRQGLRGLGLEIADTPVPIISVKAPRSDLSAVAEALKSRGIQLRRSGPLGYSDSPSVETLRIAVFATHTAEQLDRLIAALAETL